MERTTTKTVVFHRPFAIGGVDGLLPPGSYAVEMEEELIPGVSFLGLSPRSHDDLADRLRDNDGKAGGNDRSGGLGSGSRQRRPSRAISW